MTFRAKKPTYSDYESGLRSLLKGKQPPLIFIYGPSEFLVNAARRELEDWFRAAKTPVVALEAATLDASAFRELSEQSTLFDPKSAYVLKRAEQNKQLSKLLDSVPSANSMNSHFIVVANTDKLLATITKSLARLEAVVLPCFEPWPSDMPPLIQKLAAKKSLKLQPEAIHAFLEAVGTDLAKLDNELDKIALLGLAERALSGSDVRPFLGLIREDHIFKLDQLLANRHWSQAHALCSDLLARGEKGLQILWVFSNHCRKVLQAHSLLAEGVSPRDIGFKLRLPPPLTKSYTALIGRTKPERYRHVLALCQEADMALKTSRASENLILGQLVESLAGRS